MPDYCRDRAPGGTLFFTANLLARRPDLLMAPVGTKVLTMRINAALRAKLDALAHSAKRSKSFLAAEAIAAYVELNEWQIGEITAGVAELDSGEALSKKQGEERYKRLFQPR
jgi:RHH-type transcriptional regulator, rel operon repressor / antitoxin RelB